jgi:hypothetical protein
MGQFPRHLNGITIHSLPTEALGASPQASPGEKMVAAASGGSMGSMSPASFNGVQMGLPGTPLATPTQSSSGAGGIEFLTLAGNDMHHQLNHHHQLHDQQQQPQLHDHQLHQIHQHHATTAAALASLQAATAAVAVPHHHHPQQPLGFWDEMVWDTFPDAAEPPGGLPPGLAAAAAAAQDMSHSPAGLGIGTPVTAWPPDLPGQPVGGWGFAGSG